MTTIIKEDSIEVWLRKSLYTNECLEGKYDFRELINRYMVRYCEEKTMIKADSAKVGDFIEMHFNTSVGIYNLRMINILTFEVKEYDSMAHKLKLIKNEVKAE